MSLRDFKPYPKYKDSGVEWLGEVPEHWEMKRLRFVAKFNPSKTEAALLDRSTEVSFLPMEAINNDGSLDLERTRPIGELETGYTYFREGDVGIAKITPCFENGKGAIMRGLFGGIGFGTTELIVARPKIDKTSSQYLYQIFISSPFRKFGEAAMYGAGGQKRVPDDFIQDFSTAFPPLSEQLSISSFLDHETSHIDILISEKERLISLLQEYRQALISHAVTKGLDPNVKMKDSGVKWLGEVPEHWEILQGSRLFSQQRQPAFPNDKQLSATQKYGVLPQELFMELEDQKVTLALNGINNFKHVEKDDFVISLRSFQGGIEWSKYIGCVSPAYTVLRSKQLIEAKYWAFVMKSNGFIATLQTVSDGIRDGKNISYDQFSIINFPLPPFSEQSAIAIFLDQKISRIDTLISEARKFIDLLKEYRSSLITAAVTGKIDVREVVPSGPEKRGIAHE